MPLVQFLEKSYFQKQLYSIENIGMKFLYSLYFFEGIDYKKEMGHYNFSALLNKEESINDDMFVGVVFDSVE